LGNVLKFGSLLKIKKWLRRRRRKRKRKRKRNGERRGLSEVVECRHTVFGACFIFSRSLYTLCE